MDEEVVGAAGDTASTCRAQICDLPNELLLCIFSFLPVADLAQSAATCQRWHGLVSSYSHLWQGKAYRSYNRPSVCDETRAVLNALPPFRQVSVHSSTHHFMVEVSFPRLLLSVKCASILSDCPTVRCECLSARLDTASDILYSRTVIDLERLQHLRVLRMGHPDSRAPGLYSADRVVREALRLCPNLRHLTVITDFESAESLETVEGLGRVQTLVMECPGLRKLSFLRLCSAALESLTLVELRSLPSQEFAVLRQLQSLRRLRLTDCRFQEGDLVAAVGALGQLESLQLDRCSCVRDLSALQGCARLRELRVTCSAAPGRTVPRRWRWPQLRQLRLSQLRPPSRADGRPLRTVGASVSAPDMPTVLARLRRLGMRSSCVDYLAALSRCPRLRYVCCEFVRAHVYDGPEQADVQLHVTLTGPILEVL